MIRKIYLYTAGICKQKVISERFILYRNKSSNKLTQVKSNSLSMSISNNAMSSAANENSIIVDTENGRIRGYTQKSFFKERAFHSFKGIPFAEAPVDERRFKVNIATKLLKMQPQ